MCVGVGWGVGRGTNGAVREGLVQFLHRRYPMVGFHHSRHCYIHPASPAAVTTDRFPTQCLGPGVPNQFVVQAPALAYECNPCHGVPATTFSTCLYTQSKLKS